VLDLDEDIHTDNEVNCEAVYPPCSL